MADRTRYTGNLVSNTNLFSDPTTDRIGIGTTNPTSKLHVVGNVNVSGMLSSSNINTGIITATEYYGTFKGTLDTTVSSTASVAYASTAGIATVAQGLTGTPSISITNLNVSGVTTLGTVRISSGIITATSGIVTYFGDGSRLTGVSAGLSISDDTVTNATRYVLFDDVTSGTITAANVSSTKLTFNPSIGDLSATQFTSLSDASKKIDIRSIENPIEIVKQLDGVRFKWKDTKKESIGVIAQEIEKILPEVVETSNNGTKSVSYGNLVAVLIEAIKEQQICIEELRSKFNA